MSNDDPLTFETMMSFAAEQMEGQRENAAGEMPDHAARLIVGKSTKLLETMTNVEIVDAQAEASDDIDPYTEEEKNEDLAMDAVEILLAIGALAYEHDIDIEGQFEERIRFTEAYEDFQEAAQDAETQADVLAAMDEHLTEEMRESMEAETQDPIEPGDNVDRDGYDGEDDRSYA